MTYRDLQKMVESDAGVGSDGHPPPRNSVSVAQLLKAREFRPDMPPPPLRSIYSLTGIPICTPGNLAAITASIKTGKTAVLGAMAAAAMSHEQGADLLGFSSSNPKGLALLWFDSEQSPDDFWHCVHRAILRARLTNAPAWLHPYCLTGLACHVACECMMEALHVAVKEHAGIHSMLLDGAADFIDDVNDPRQSNVFVANLHALALEHECSIIGVIHFNPGSDRARGHLGSQLERKAETNLRLDKTNGVTTIWSDKQRRTMIPKNSGPRFAWSD
jgi:hypothetical protein